MSLNQTYQIDQTQINKIRNRVFVRGLKIMLITVGSITVLQYLQWRKSNESFLWQSLPLTLPLLVLPLYVGATRVKKAYQTLKIVLSAYGVEMKADMMPYKAIAWQNLKIEEKQNGIVKLTDKSMSAFMTWMYGRGVIIIQPETLNRDVLLSEMYKRSYQ